MLTCYRYAARGENLESGLGLAHLVRNTWMQFGFIAGIVAMSLREVDYLDGPGHAAGA